MAAAATDAKSVPGAGPAPPAPAKAIVKRTVDYTAMYLTQYQAILRGTPTCAWQQLQGTQPLATYEESYRLLPDKQYLTQPASNMMAKLITESLNKAKSAINTVFWLPDGKRCMTGASSGEFALWDGKNFALESFMQGHEAPIRSLVGTHSEMLLISSDDNGRIKMWNGKRDNFLDPLHTIPAHREPCRSLSVAPTDRKFCSASDDSTIKIHDLALGTTEATLLGHGGDVRWVEWHPRQGLLASGSKDALAKLWDPRAGGTAVCTLHGHKNGLMQVRWNPQNDNWLLTASRDQTLKVYDVRSPVRELGTYQGNQRDVTSACWHPHQEELFASGSYDGAIMFWLVGKTEAQCSLLGAHEREVWSLAWHPVGHVLASGSGDVTTKFWCRSRPGDLFRERWHESEIDAGLGLPVGLGMGMGTVDAVGGGGGGASGAKALPGPPVAPGLGGTLARIPGLGDIVNKLVKTEPPRPVAVKAEPGAPAAGSDTRPASPRLAGVASASATGRSTPPLPMLGRGVPGPAPPPGSPPPGQQAFRDVKRSREQFEGSDSAGPRGAPGPSWCGPGPPRPGDRDWGGPRGGPPGPGGGWDRWEAGPGGGAPMGSRGPWDGGGGRDGWRGPPGEMGRGRGYGGPQDRGWSGPPGAGGGGYGTGGPPPTVAGMSRAGPPPPGGRWPGSAGRGRGRDRSPPP